MKKKPSHAGVDSLSFPPKNPKATIKSPARRSTWVWRDDDFLCSSVLTSALMGVPYSYSISDNLLVFDNFGLMIHFFCVIFIFDHASVWSNFGFMCMCDFDLLVQMNHSAGHTWLPIRLSSFYPDLSLYACVYIVCFPSFMQSSTEPCLPWIWVGLPLSSDVFVYSCLFFVWLIYHQLNSVLTLFPLLISYICMALNLLSLAYTIIV